jgi:hypothetical protein
MRPPKYWIKGAIKKPGLVRWYSHWQSSLDGMRSPLTDELPWLTYQAIDWLSSHLTKEMSLFEWGLGGSTAFFSHRVDEVFSVEHDPLWFDEVMSTLRVRMYLNVSPKLVTPSSAENIDPWFRSTDVSLSGRSLEAYVRSIETYPDNTFDVVLVDGRARPGCMKYAMAKIKSGGYLILDNSERIEYAAGRQLVAEWRDVRFSGPGPYNALPWETRIWQKRNG